MTVSLLNRGALTALASVLILILIIPACGSNGGAPLGSQPDGQLPTANPALEAELRAELVRQLEAAGIDAAAPARSVARVQPGDVCDAHVYSPGSVFMSDGYEIFTLCSQVVVVHRLAGDTDNNGEVNMADITPLAQFWHHAVQYREENGRLLPEGDPESNSLGWRLAAADADRNGEINSADIAPIARNWGVRVTHYHFRRFDPATNQMTTILPIPLNEMHGEIPFFLMDDTGVSKPVEDYDVVPVNDNQSPDTSNDDPEVGPPTPPVSVPIDVPSVVVVEPDEPEGEAPHTVVVDAGESTDPNSAELEYDFDLVGIDEELLDFKQFTDPSTKSFTLTDPGEYIIRVSVRDKDQGRVVTAGTTTVTVTEPVTDPGPTPHLP